MSWKAIFLYIIIIIIVAVHLLLSVSATIFGDVMIIRHPDIW